MLSRRTPKLSLIGWLVMLLGLGIVGASCLSLPVTSSENSLGSIYYESMNSIWRLKIPSGSPMRLADNVIDSPLSLSSNQQWLAYLVYDLRDGQKLMSIWIVDTQGKQAIKVSNEVPFAESNWTDDNRLVVTEYPDFHLDQNTGRTTWGQGSTYSFEPQTGGRHSESSLTPITDHSQCRIFPEPSQLRDMAEKCDNTANENYIRIVRLDGSNPITLAQPYKGGDVVWSVDGNKLAYSSRDDSGDSQLFIWYRNDSNTKRLTLGKVDFIAPSWSPDGESIAYESGGNDLCVVSINSNEPKCFQGYVSALGVPPAWSPDSHSIVLASNRIGGILFGESSSNWDLFAINIPGGEVTRITHDANIESRPIWGR